MKVLVVGGGGREHALVWKIAQSPLVEKVYCAPGNPGIGAIAENVPLAVDDLPGLLAFAKEKEIGLTVVGPELPLSLGIVDLFEEHGLLIFGARRNAAYIEASLKDLWAKTRKGLAFNMLCAATKSRKEHDLYYADWRVFHDFCVKELSPHVSVLRDYHLAEWTIHVRRR